MTLTGGIYLESPMSLSVNRRFALLMPMCILRSQKIRFIKKLGKHPGGGELTTLWDGCFRVLAASRPQQNERNYDL